jgi:hypothetical protein
MANAAIEMAPDAGLRCRLSGTGQIASGVSLTNSDLIPGIAGGVLTTGAVTFGQGSVLEIDLLSSATSSQGRLDSGGTVTISQVAPQPELRLNLGFAPSPGQAFVILNNNSPDFVDGYFAELPEHGILDYMLDGKSCKFSISYRGGDGNDVVLTAAGAAIPGDANGDNLVDQADYTVWYNSYGNALTGPQCGDFDCSGLVDQADYSVWYDNYGRSAASQGILGGSLSGKNDLGLVGSSFSPDFSGISPVPEPVCALFMGSALLRIFLGGRRFSPCKKNRSAVG